MLVRSRKELAALLSNLEGYRCPKEKLEQWQTPPEIAATMLFEALIRGDISGKKIIDLGTGTGILAIGAALLSAKEVIGVDIDPEALEIAQRNLMKIKEIYGSLPIKFVCTDIREFDMKGDTVVMNPPFGLERWSRHADIVFLEKAFSLASKVYSLHHSTSKGRKFLIKYAQRYGFQADIIGTFNFPLKAWHEKHRKPVKEIPVDFILFVTKTVK